MITGLVNVGGGEVMLVMIFLWVLILIGAFILISKSNLSSQSKILWGLGIVLFGPFGLIFYLIIGSKKL
jgi:hypothetical protein